MRATCVAASKVVETLRQALSEGKSVRVNMVVRPDTLECLAFGLTYLHSLGIRHVDISLDLWTTWSRADALRLEHCVRSAGELWKQWLPDFSLNWFDSMAGKLAHLPGEEDTRCGFGDGEIAVAPSGRLYPCERRIGEDRPDAPFCLPGHALDGDDFLACAPASFQQHPACSQCALSPVCDTTCRCSNYVRTGNTNNPDGLLCVLNKATARITSELLTTSSQRKESPIHVEREYV